MAYARALVLRHRLWVRDRRVITSAMLPTERFVNSFLPFCNIACNVTRHHAHATSNIKTHRIFHFLICALINTRRFSLRPEDDTIARSVLTLRGYLNSIMTSIFKSVQECPVFMRIVFRNLARRVYQHFGDDSGNEVILHIHMKASRQS